MGLEKRAFIKQKKNVKNDERKSMWGNDGGKKNLKGRKGVLLKLREEVFRPYTKVPRMV